MARFAYLARTRTGQEERGTLVARTIEEATQQLKAKGLTVVSVQEKRFRIPLPGGGISTKDLVIFTRTFVTMLESGLAIVQALQILAQQQTNKTFKRVILGVKESVEQGGTLADSMRRFPEGFDNLYCNLVQAGETGGVLDTVLNRLAVFLEKQEKIRKQVKGAMTYPIIVLCIALAAVALMLLKVIPTFEKMFSEFGKELPAPTQIVINMSHWLQARWWVVLLFIIAFVALLQTLNRIEKTAWYMDMIKLKIPLIGNLIHKTALTRFAQTLGTLLGSGVAIVEALEICKGVVGNRLIAEEVARIQEAIREGKQLVEPLRSAKFFPLMFTQMVEVGESTGRLDQMLARTAAFYEEEVDAAVEAITSAIEPIMMVFLGGMVGGLLIAMYLPIFSLAGTAGGGG